MPQRTTRRLSILASLLVFAACDSLVEPRGSVPVEFSFGVHRPANEPAFLVQPGTDALVVRGMFRTPCQPYHARASVDVVERTLVLRIVGEASGDCPQDAVVSVGYQALVRAPSSEYTRVRIRHEWRDASWATETVADTLVSAQ